MRKPLIDKTSEDNKLPPDKVRLSIGTASVLGLIKYKLDIPPTTAYTMTYTDGGCTANCSFCSQARENHSDKELLSRVIWPEFNLNKVLNAFKKPKSDVVERICLQTINYPGFEEDALGLVKAYKENTDLPVSLDTCPVNRDILELLKETEVERISIPLDAATPEIFDEIKGRYVNGPYRWEKHVESLQEAVDVFGRGFVGTNLIVGLGEKEEEAVRLIQRMHDMGVEVILFAFTPIRGTKLSDREQPDLKSYRRIQVSRYLISKGILTLKEVIFDEDGKILGFKDREVLWKELLNGAAFQTNGCPGCNRPFYNERPTGPFYNYPRPLKEKETLRELELMELV